MFIIVIVIIIIIIIIITMLFILNSLCRRGISFYFIELNYKFSNIFSCAVLMLLESVPLLNFSRYLVTAAGYTEFHLHSLVVFLSQSGLPQAHIR